MYKLSQYKYDSASTGYSSHYLLPAIGKLLQTALPTTIESSKVIDLGCGNGTVMRSHFGSCLSDGLFGIDGSARGIEFAQSALPQCDFRVGDLAADLSDHPAFGQCDLVISTEVVEHLFDPRSFARNCFGFLKPGGKALISTPYHGYLKNLLLALSGRLDFHYTPLWVGGHIKFWSRKTLSQLFEESGFKVIGFQGVGRFPFLWKSMILVLERPIHS